MDWSVALPNIWFLLITILFTGFFVLEGYDFGVGVLAQVLGKTDEDKRVYFFCIHYFNNSPNIFSLSLAPNKNEPQTNRSAPLSRQAFDVSVFIPPSTSIKKL